jgi:hypothetical protein
VGSFQVARIACAGHRDKENQRQGESRGAHAELDQEDCDSDRHTDASGCIKRIVIRIGTHTHLGARTGIGQLVRLEAGRVDAGCRDLHAILLARLLTHRVQRSWPRVCTHMRVKGPTAYQQVDLIAGHGNTCFGPDTSAKRSRGGIRQPPTACRAPSGGERTTAMHAHTGTGAGAGAREQQR